MDPKKRKVDGENRKFSEEWTEKYCFVLPDTANAIPVCLICNKTVAIIKSSNLKRHYDTNHGTFDKTFPLGSSTRQQHVNKLAASYQGSKSVMVRSMTNQEKSTEASLRVAWILNKHQKPFSDSEIAKEIMVEVATALFEDKKDVVVPLSARSNTRRTEILATDNKETLLNMIQDAPCYALALDESCDIVDDEQLAVFVRFFDKESDTLIEELLDILKLKGKTRGEELFQVLDDTLKKFNLSYDKWISVSTDGAPAMVGKDKGLVRKIRDMKPDLLSYHCIIHQTVLCAKLSPQLQAVLDKFVHLINFIRSRSSLQHQEFKAFLSECEAAQSDLIQYNNIRWLSKGKVIEWFWEIKEHVITFLGISDARGSSVHLDFLENRDNISVLAFLNDILVHLNNLNIRSW